MILATLHTGTFISTMAISRDSLLHTRISTTLSVTVLILFSRVYI